MEGGPTKTRALLLAAAALAAWSALHPSPLHADDADAPARVVARPGEPAGAGTRAGPGPATDAAAPDGPEAARREPSREERRWARSVFFDLRGRGPRPDELEAVLAVPPEAAVDRLLSDLATWEAWVERELYFYLLIDRFRPVSDRVVALKEQEHDAPAAVGLGILGKVLEHIVTDQLLDPTVLRVVR